MIKFYTIEPATSWGIDRKAGCCLWLVTYYCWGDNQWYYCLGDDQWYINPDVYPDFNVGQKHAEDCGYTYVSSEDLKEWGEY